MKTNNRPPAANVSLKGINLVSSNFNRGYLDDPGTLNFQIDISTQENGEDLFVFETVSLQPQDSNEFSFTVKMRGAFVIPEGVNIPLEQFSHINAAATIYAYIRQYISSTTLQAGIKPVVLPLVNFIEHYKNVKNQKEG